MSENQLSIEQHVAHLLELQTGRAPTAEQTEAMTHLNRGVDRVQNALCAVEKIPPHSPEAAEIRQRMIDSILALGELVREQQLAIIEELRTGVPAPDGVTS